MLAPESDEMQRDQHETGDRDGDELHCFPWRSKGRQDEQEGGRKGCDSKCEGECRASERPKADHSKPHDGREGDDEQALGVVSDSELGVGAHEERSQPDAQSGLTEQADKRSQQRDYAPRSERAGPPQVPCVQLLEVVAAECKPLAKREGAGQHEADPDRDDHCGDRYESRLA